MDKRRLFAVKAWEKDGAACDEGIVYECNGRYFLRWIGTNKTKRISEKMVTEFERELLKRVNNDSD